MSSAAGLPLPATSPSVTMIRPSAKWQDIEEISADRVGGSSDAADFDIADGECPSREQGQLDLARHFQLSLQRQPVCHFQQHQQVDQEQADQQGDGPIGPGRE